MGNKWVDRVAGGVRALRNAFYAYAIAWAALTFEVLFSVVAIGVLAYVGINILHGNNVLMSNAPLKSFVVWYFVGGVVPFYVATAVMVASLTAFLYYYWSGLSAVDEILKHEQDSEYTIAFGLRRPIPIITLNPRQLRKFLQWGVVVGIAVFTVGMTVIVPFASEIISNDTLDTVIGVSAAVGLFIAILAMLILIRILGSFLRNERLMKANPITHLAPFLASVGGIRIARELDRAIRAWVK